MLQRLKLFGQKVRKTVPFLRHERRDKVFLIRYDELQAYYTI